jgi:hypothetical protein
LIGPAAALAVAGLLLTATCGPPTEPPAEERIALTDVAPETVLPGTRLRFHGEGFLPSETVTARFSGTFAGEAVEVGHALAYADRRTLVLVVGTHLFPGAAAEEGTFSGQVTLSVVRGGAVLRAEADVTLDFARALVPAIGTAGPDAISFMDVLTVGGTGFLLEGEGATRALLDGTFHPDGGAPVAVDALELPLTVLDRTHLEARWGPELLGLVTGRFEGTLQLVNAHLGPGGEVDGAALGFEMQVLRPAVASISPPAASRGQAIVFLGHGFLPADGHLDQQTRLRLTGTFTRQDGTPETWSGATSVDLEGTWTAPGRLQYVIRPRPNAQRVLEGFGHTPGTFTGRIDTTVRHGGVELPGVPWEGSFEVLPTRQVVYLKYVPTFSEALRRFGLRNVETEIRARILEVCNRDYADFHVDFRDRRPDDFVDYSVIELAGRDPNEAGLFGLDNTDGKDEGNLRLDDVIGGYNAEAEEQGYFSYGGVFLESFLSFSPNLDEGRLPAEYRSSRFDNVFSYFIPDLGGTPVAAGEYPGGLRDPQIAEAIRVLGNLVGNTVVHEIGHSLGLVPVEGRYHHDGTEAGLIMNPGQARSFVERAELDGHGPPDWHEIDRAYLAEILPLP